MIVKKVIYINIALVILKATNYVCSAKHYKLCVTEDKKRSRYCDLLSSPDAEVNCIAALDSHDCAFKLKNQEADFAVFTAEQIAFVAPVINHYTEIIFKVQESRDLSTYKLRMGVVVEKDISLTTLKGKRYCHPGFGNSDRNDHVMKIFESQVVPRGNCSSNSLDIENELDSLTNFFGDNSCRPGMWTEDDNLEAKLRKQYGKLCANCYNPEKCSNNPSRNNHDEGALRCVTQRGGQVAYVSIDAVKEYFKVFGESAAKYSYMCRDGTKMDISVDEPCAWYEEPFDAIVALSEYATELQNKIKDWVNRSEEWYKSLKLVLKVYDHRPLISFNGKPSDYAKNVIGSTNIPSCERTIKWCTTLPLENSKCETLKRAAALHAIKPELSCVQADNVWQCLNKTKENENDILGIDTSLAYLAYKYYYVEPMKYQECREEDKYKTVAIVKTSTANSFVELEKKNACFPEFGGLAHITIFEKLKDMKKVKKACLDDDLMDQFFNKTCIPSVLPEVNDAKELGSANNYCSLCASSNCSIATKRSYFPDAKAIECLVTNPGSIAFINANSIRTILDDPAYHKFPEDQYRILCQDGQEMSLNKTVNNACSFGTFYNGLIVASKYLSSIHLKDIDLAFLKMDSLFGPNSKLWLFNMYGAYNGAGDLLFKGKAVKLASNTSESVSQLTGLMKSLEKCSISTERSTIDRPIDREMDLFLYSSLQETTTNLAGVDNREDLAKSLMNCSKSSGFAVMASACVVPLTVSLSVFVIMS